MKKLAILFCLFFVFSCRSPVEDFVVEITHFKGMYDLVLANLVAPGHTMWEDDIVGKIKGDRMYDGGAFAPKALADAGYNIQARQVLDYVTSLQEASTTEFIVGFGSYATGKDIYPSKWNWCNMIGLGTNVGVDIALLRPNPIGEFFGYISALGSVANTAFVNANACLNSQLFTKGKLALAKLNNEYWKDEKGYYHDDSIPAYLHFASFQNSTALWALTWYYGISHDYATLQKIDRLYTEAEDKIFVPEIGGYKDYTVTPLMDLGANLQWARGWLWAYWVTGNVKYLNKTEQLLNFIQSYLLIDDLQHPGFKILSHDWYPERGAIPIYCTGCNYLALIVIREFNEIKSKGALVGQIPVQKPSGSCGVLVGK